MQAPSEIPIYRHFPTILLTDLDNTVFTSTRALANSLRAMMHRLAESGQTGRPETEVQTALKTVYSQEGVNTFQLVQELRKRSLLGVTEANEGRLIPSVQEAYHGARTNALHPAEGVPDLLKEVRAHRIQVIALTDAELLETMMKFRAHYTQLFQDDDLFDRLVAQKGDYSTFKEVDWRKFNDLTQDVEYPFESIMIRKPDTPLAELLGLGGYKEDDVRHYIQQNVAILGDNYHLDMGLAIRWGMRGYHARWLHQDIIQNAPKIAEFLSEEDAALYAPTPFVPVKYPANIVPVDHPSELYTPLGLAA